MKKARLMFLTILLLLSATIYQEYQILVYQYYYPRMIAVANSLKNDSDINREAYIRCHLMREQM